MYYVIAKESFVASFIKWNEKYCGHDFPM